MRLHRFIVSFPITDEMITVKETALIYQWQKVLRLKPDDEIILSDGNGTERRVIIVSLERAATKLKIVESYKNEHEPSFNVLLYASIIKRDNFEWLAQKAVECGVKSITPITTERTVKTKLNETRIKKIMHEAAEQSFRASIPKLNKILSFEEALKDAEEKSAQIFICDPTYKDNLIQSLKNISRAVFIGPEGGFTERELQLAELFGALKLSLGKTILRAETAAIVAVHKLAN
ncbi:MAG: RsmE family RNA methyltransferase [bacterium]|nr:RsmE family RNA methyltransferase [bacterium]